MDILANYDSHLLDYLDSLINLKATCKYMNDVVLYYLYNHRKTFSLKDYDDKELYTKCKCLKHITVHSGMYAFFSDKTNNFDIIVSLNIAKCDINIRFITMYKFKRIKLFI